jgi:outer membrane protein OmpA-like peptidoglycan-associated protein
MKRVFALGLLAALAGCATGPTTRHAPLIATPTSCADIHFPVYFEERSASVTPEAERLIVDAQRRATGCTVTRIDVLGLADAPGGPVANMELSQDRAAAVAEALGRHGFPKALVQQAAVGEAGALAPSGAARPLRRRANVTIHLAPPAH